MRSLRNGRAVGTRVAEHADEADFDGFVAARAQRLLGPAYLLTADRAAAEDLLRVALVRAWSTWSRIDDDPEPHVRALVVATYTSWWRRVRHPGAGSGEPPEGPGPGQAPLTAAEVAARLELWRALARLPRRQRAALVLRYAEDLTEEESGRALGISTGAVRTGTGAALAQLGCTGPALATTMRGWTDALPAQPGRVSAVRQLVRRHRRMVSTANAAALCAVVAVTAVVATHTSAGRPGAPAVRRGPSHPAPVIPDVVAGSVVTGQVSGTGAQSRILTLRWPDPAGLGIVIRCDAAAGVIAVSRDGIGTGFAAACPRPSGTEILDLASYFPHVRPGTRVRLSVTATSQVTGPWAVAVLIRDPHWLDAARPAPTLGGATLRHWARGSGDAAVTVRLTAGDAHPVFVLGCGQAGGMTLLLDGTQVGSVLCQDVPWSEHTLTVADSVLTSVGFVPGRTVTLAVRWQGPAPARLRVAQYG